MEKTKLSQHIKKGDTLHTPFTGLLGEQLKLTSWSRDKLPQYIWIAIILDFCGRDKGLNTLGCIMNDLKENDICIAELSGILILEEKKQQKFYSVIDKYIPKHVLSPLSLVFSSYECPWFFDHYCSPEIDINQKIDRLNLVIKNTLYFHSNQATDICFIINWFHVTNGRLIIAKGCNILADALSNYHNHSHNEEIMQKYRSSIRASVQGLGLRFEHDNSFSLKFWDKLAEISSCVPMLIDFSKKEGKMKSTFYKDICKVIEYIDVTSRDKIQTVKFSVIMGITTYAVKLYSEIRKNKLDNTISARIIFRTIIESYINLKYLMFKEPTQSDIYEMFQNYGIGKYKFVMAKIREGKYSSNEFIHFDSKALEIYVNEFKSEEFQEISLGFFDRDSIRNKFNLVNESELYEIYYEYDTNFAHALWGSIRESATLLCDNPAHLYHTVPDYTFEQELISINGDCEMVLKKLFHTISSFIELPDFYIKKYEVGQC